MSNVAGSKVWFIPDGFYHSKSTGDIPSHEAVCVLNVGKEDAVINITLYFMDREKRTGFEVVCKAERAMHIGMDKIKDKDGNGVSVDLPYSMVVESSSPIIVQYSRVDTSAGMALMTTIAYPL